MRTQSLLSAALLILLFTGCMENDVYTGKERPKEFNEFDFSTVRQGVVLNVAYLNKEVQAKVYFEVYDECPVTETESGYAKRDGVTPLFAAYTDTDGKFSTTLDLPAYVQKVWIFSPAFYACSLIEATVKEGVISATRDMAATRAVTSTDEEHYSYMDENAPYHPNEYKDGNWKTWLGSYDKRRNGMIEYPYNGDLKVDNAASVYEIHSSVFSVNGSCPDEYRSYSDIYVKENAEVAVTFLGQYTCWNCSLGYYYYTDSNKPDDLKDAHVIMLFPNTQDGSWSKPTENVYSMATAGVMPGTAVQLKYYPDIASSGTKDGETTIFPAGTRIGFVLANNSWKNRIDWRVTKNANKRYRAATSSGLSVKNDGNKYNVPRTAVYRFDNHLMISFEDHTDDQNFTDVVIAMKANPALAIDAEGGVPDISKDNITTTRELRGIYAFEDLWPNQGDYDLNDVVVHYDHEKSLNAQGQIVGESFIFKTFQNFAANQNGLAFRLKPIADGTTSCYIRTAGSSEFQPTVFPYEQGDGVYLLTDDVKKNMGAEYKVTTVFKKPVSSGESTVQPFIYRATEGDKRWEVHIAKEAPTSKMDTSFFGQGDDASRPSEGLYYVRSGNYPFAFFLSGATESDLSKLLDRQNESKAIDQLYSGYAGWAGSNGQSNADWYKK